MAARLLGVVALGSLLAGCAAPVADLSLPSARAATDCLSSFAGVDLDSASVADLADALADGRATSVGLVEAYVARIEAFDRAGPKVNSVQVVNADARAIAASLDAERASGIVRGPLHGIPILLKDNVGTKDMPTTAGSIALAKNVPEDATLTARLRDAGAVILGKTKLSEFANWMSSSMPNGYSSLGGQVVNAYTGGDPGGSSSGSGVAGSMAFAAVTIGTETSGSILSPSEAGSLVGVKPTTGLVSRAGVIPLAASFDTPGPMGRSVLDVATVLGAIAGTDEQDAATADADASLPPESDYTTALRAEALQGVRLGYDPAFAYPLFLAALDDLERAGATLVPITSHPDVQVVGLAEFPLIFNEFKHGINQYLASEAAPEVAVDDLTEIILYNQGHPDKVKYGQDMLVASDATPGAPGDAAALPVVAANRATADALFDGDDVDALVGPGLAYVALGAAAGYPTVIVPMGFEGREPWGLSFFGRAWSEADLLAYAYAYEQASARRSAPASVNPSLVAGVCADAPVAEAAARTPPLPLPIGLPALGGGRLGT